MLATATAVESVDREMINAKYAATIPAICKLLPVAIESRPNSLRLVPSPRFIVRTLAVSRKILIIVEIRRLHQLRDSVGDGDLSPTSSEWSGGRPPYVPKASGRRTLWCQNYLCLAFQSLQRLRWAAAMLFRAAPDRGWRFRTGLPCFEVVLSEASPSRAEIACAMRCCSCLREVSTESIFIGRQC